MTLPAIVPASNLAKYPKHDSRLWTMFCGGMTGEAIVLEIRLLGPVEAYSSGTPVPLGGAKPRALLAMLVLERGRVVSTSQLVDVLWPEEPPGSARALVQTYVSSLRKSFAQHGFADVIVTKPPGYALRSDSAIVDVETFGQLVSAAKQSTQAGDHLTTSELLRQAISLWRGTALSGLENSPVSHDARRLHESLMMAAEERFEAELSLGRLDHLSELTGTVAKYPANERLRGQLMITLYRLGRQADALACYREGRDVLAEQLGISPGPDLDAVFGAILRGDDNVLRASQSDPDHPRPLPVPGQIPPAPGDFTGRRSELAGLTASLSKHHPGTCIVAGQGGSGKSALAVFAAHQVAMSFPEGQLYAELRGMSQTPASPGEVLGGFLRALGMDPMRIPESTPERTELFRSLVADCRMLILLDDAASEQQVRPLLPGGPKCGVLITSRDRLAGLSGATWVELDVLADGEAWQLLERMVGDDRVAADPESVTRILAACENLPLAIRIAGSRLATRRNLPCKVMADRLADERQRLNELVVGDLAVRSSISLSYQASTGQAQMALRRLGYLGIPEFSAQTLGSLVETTQPEAERLLELLVDAQLVMFIGVDSMGTLRYRLHDLIGLYARERAEAEEPADALRESVARVLQGWHAVLNNIAATSPPAEIVWRQPLEPALRIPGRSDEILADGAGWLRAEEACLVIGAERAAAIGLHRLVCDFVSARIAVELEGANRLEFRSRIINAALAAAQQAGDAYGEAVMLTELAQLRYTQDLFIESRQHFGEALSRFRALHDVRGQAAALAGLGIACREPGRLAEALHFLNQAATLLQTLGDTRGIGYVCRLTASVLIEQGNFTAAHSHLEHSLRAYQEAGSRRGMAYTLRTLGLYHRARGAYQECQRFCAESAEIFEEFGDEHMTSYAVRAHAKAQIRLGHAAEALPRLEWVLSVAREVNDRWGEAAALDVLGQLHLSEGRLEPAETCLLSAITIWKSIQSPLWTARTQYRLAQICMARDDVDAARKLETDALKVFHDHGSREYTEAGRPITAVAAGL